jgi:HK97 family phage major capsid protein
MSNRIKELEEKRGQVRKDSAAVLAKATAEKRELNGEEIAKVKEFRTTEENIGETLIAEHRALSAAANEQKPLTESEQRTVDRFSVVRAVNTLLNGQQLDGAEAEMHQEGMKAYRAANLTPNGNFVIPQIVLSRGQYRGFEKRDQTATGGSSGSEGGVLVQTNVGSIIERLKAKLLIGQMGAQSLGGLVGNIDFPVFGANDAATEKTEVAAASESSPTWTKKTISPKRLPVFGEYSRQLLAQSSHEVEGFVRNDLAYQIAKRMDAMAINGSGSSNEPTGILNTSGIGSVVGGTNGIVPTWDHIVDLETEVAVDDADVGSLGYMTTPGIRGKLKKTKTDTGSGIFVWPSGARELNGYNVGVSTQVPSTLTKGTAVGTAHAIIFGNFSDLLIGQWGGVEFMVNPYSKDTEGIVRINAWTFYDILVRRAQSFAAMKDALIA